MPFLQRLLWGLLAGAMLVLVKIIGPDQALVTRWFSEGTSGEVTTYFVVSAFTILLSVCAGLYSTETDRLKFLLFCASAPALLATATGERRIPDRTDTPTEQSSPRGASPDNAASLSFFGTAYAKGKKINIICEEPGFFREVARNTKDYLRGRINSSDDTYIVVVESTKNLERAKQTAEKIAASHPEWAPKVGCRRPGNDYFPVFVGQESTQAEAAELLGRFSEVGLLPGQPYLSSYPYREIIYTPSSD